MKCKLCNLLCTRDGTGNLVFLWYIGCPIVIINTIDTTSWFAAIIIGVGFFLIPISFNSWREKYCKKKCSDTHYISNWDPDSPGYFTRQMLRDAEAKELGISPIEYEAQQILVDEAMRHIKKRKEVNDNKISSTKAKYLKK